MSISMSQTFNIVQIEPVTTKKMMSEFIKFPFTLYQGDVNWVPPLIEERQDFVNLHKNPFFEHARCQFFIARRNAQIVGTIVAVIDDLYNQYHKEQLGSFGFFEAINDPTVAMTLLQTAEAWLRQQGMKIIRGPMQFSSNHEWGLLVDGFDEPPMVMMTYNPRYYAPLVEANGYHKAMDLYGYIGDLDERWHNAPPGIFRVAEKAARKAGIRVRKANIHDFNNEVQRIKQIYARAWENFWGFVPLTEHEADYMAHSLRPIIEPDFVFFAETSDGTPIGVSLALPDLHQALKWSGGGHMFPFGLAKFLWHKRRVNQVRLLLMGVVEEYRGRGIDAIFYVETARAALARGYKRIEGSWVLETNTMMNRIIGRLGGTLYKTYRIYEKAL